GRGVLDEAFGGVFATIEDDVLDALEQCRRDVLVDGELAGVDDAHVEARAYRVIEEDRVHRLTHRVVATKGETEVRDPARDLHAGAARLDLRDGGDERVRELRVLLDPRCDGEHVRVEDDVLGLPAVSRQELVGALADVELARRGVGLTLLVEGHHDYRGAVMLDLARLGEEVLLSLLEADRVYDAFPLQALEPRLEHAPLGAVDHDRDARYVRLGGHHVEKGRDRLLRIQQVGVHVHVEDVGAATDLLERDLDGLLKVAGFD